MTIHPLRHNRLPEDHPDTIISYVGEQRPGSRTEPHTHHRAQLFHILRGSVTVEAGGGCFVVPPERAIWLPPGTLHCSTYHTATDIRFLYVNTTGMRALPHRPCVVHVTPLLRELILAFMASAPGYDRGSTTDRLASVLIDQIAASQVAPLHLPMPASARLKTAIADLVEDPAAPTSTRDLACRANLSLRSFERHFVAETGLTPRAWRRQAKLMKAVELLSQGVAVGHIADRLGYEGPSAFIASFKTAFGVTPGRYFDRER